VSILFASVSGCESVGDLFLRFSDVFAGSESAEKRFGVSKFNRAGARATGRVDGGGGNKGPWDVVAMFDMVCGQMS